MSFRMQQILRISAQRGYHAAARARSTRPFSQLSTKTAESNRQEKDQVYVDSQEYSKSGYDSMAAETEETAFTKDKTQPDELLTEAAKESKKVLQICQLYEGIQWLD